jgi:hypothetical protein
MRGTLAIAARELAERRAILLAALVAGCLPFASPLVPGLRSGEARDLMALVMAAAFGLALAILAGASVVARDLVEGRLSFDFSRPLGAASIWAGRFLGALALSLLGLMLVLGPTSLVGGGVFSESMRHPLRHGVAWLAAAIVLLVPLSHVASVAFRSRSGWLAVDLTCGVVFLLLAGIASRSLIEVYALRLLLVAGIVLGVALVVALWSCTAIQLVRGRTDLRRGHRVMSLALWSVLIAVAVAFIGYTRWVLAAEPQDLVHVSAASSPRGEWVEVAGRARGRGDYRPRFLVNARTGRFLRIGAGAVPYGSAVSFSGDGLQVAWTETAGPRSLVTEVFALDLDDPGAEPRGTRIVFPDPMLTVALSHDGTTLAAVHEGTVSAYELGTGRILASSKIPETSYTRGLARLHFTDRDHVRVYFMRESIPIFTLDVGERRLERTGEVSPGEGSWRALSFSGDRSRLLVQEHGSRGKAGLYDGVTGARIAELEPRAATNAHRSLRFLTDGRIVSAEGDDASATLRVYSPDGIEERSFTLEGSGQLLLGWEPAPGALFAARLAVRPGVALENQDRELLLIDLGLGSARAVAGRLLPHGTPGWWGGWPLVSAPVAGSVGSCLFHEDDALVLFDPRTGEKRVIAGRTG